MQFLWPPPYFKIDFRQPIETIAGHQNRKCRLNRIRRLKRIRNDWFKSAVSYASKFPVWYRTITDAAGHQICIAQTYALNGHQAVRVAGLFLETPGKAGIDVSITPPNFANIAVFESHEDFAKHATQENQRLGETMAIEQIIAGMKRPLWPEMTKCHGITYCNCGELLQTQPAIREHWQQGHFDVPVYTFIQTRPNPYPESKPETQKKPLTQSEQICKIEAQLKLLREKWIYPDEDPAAHYAAIEKLQNRLSELRYSVDPIEQLPSKATPATPPKNETELAKYKHRTHQALSVVWNQIHELATLIERELKELDK